MKTQSTFLALLLAGLFAAAADAPKIDEARINAVMTQVEAQAAESGAEIPAEQRTQLREQILRDLQRAEVLKNTAFSAGIDKKTEVQSLFKNFEAQFYAAQYVEHLKNTITPSDADLRQLYDRLGREVKIQMAAFPNEAEAQAAQEKLLKGMSFTNLLASLPNQPASPPDFISAQMLPPEMAAEIDAMDKGKISSKPVAYQGVYYLFKVADTRKGGNMPPFEQIKARLAEQKKDELVRAEVQKILTEYGLE
ncbi:MAG: peptidylprolyl isomerase [Neisseria sp.]|nr:peptidylprolyl isomerase [Neisseria sp.]